MEGCVDCVIVGAGLAGLNAAMTLTLAGKSCLVLEARDRVGGRTWSYPVGGEENLWDLGAGWVGHNQPIISGLCKKYGIETYPQYDTGKHILEIDEKKLFYENNISTLSSPDFNFAELAQAVALFDKHMMEVPLDAPQDAPRAAEWDHINMEAWERQNMKSPAAIHLLNFIIRTVFAAEPSQLSFLFFLQYLRSGGGYNKLADIVGGAQQERVVGGTQQVSLALARELGARTIVLNAPVRKIVQWEGGVFVHSDAGVYRAKSAIVALSPLLAGNIEYKPAMPTMREHLTQRMPMGYVIKSYILYKTPFWREKGFSGEVLSTGSPLCLVYDATNYRGQAALVGFVVGSATLKWSGKDQALRAAIIEQLAGFFGEQARSPQDMVVREWSTDIWSRGCYSGVANTGVLSEFGAAMRKPVGRIHWAGTETATEWIGYMEGALQSGARAAQEILATNPNEANPSACNKQCRL